ncbi:unnamed protein product, partial [marine sediment metagenome]
VAIRIGINSGSIDKKILKKIMGTLSTQWLKARWKMLDF